MGNCLSFSSPSSTLTVSDKSIKLLLSNQTAVSLPSPIPSFPPGEGFASGSIDLGGLRVCQVSTFSKVWSTRVGGPDNLGAAFFEPSSIPEGYFMLGCYSQPNNKPLSGYVLVGKDDINNMVTTNSSLKTPLDYTLVWSSVSLKIKQDGFCYIWLPTPPDGYKAVGHVITATPEKPPLDKIRCVRDDLTDPCETDAWIWGEDKDGVRIFGLRPFYRGTQDLGVPVGTFTTQTSPIINCLKNNSSSSNLFYSMPNLTQVETLIQAYSPVIYFHPDESYLPSSVNWYFNNGALLFKKGDESNPVKIDQTGANLPQRESDDGTYWLDLPINEAAKTFVKKGDLQSFESYFHIKPMLGATFTDVVMWLFYPFNGPAKVKIGVINVPLDKIGQHVGDWEHVTLRISNFNGELRKMYLSQHSSGTWADASMLEFYKDNKPVAYSSLHGHALYSKPGLVLQGSGGIGIRNDTAKSKFVMDTGVRFNIVSAEYLGMGIIEPPWLNYYRKWGPKISYDFEAEIKKVEKVLPGNLKAAFGKFVRGLPNELLGEEGPTGPKMKSSWSGDEK